jgi:hypothetical protein
MFKSKLFKPVLLGCAVYFNSCGDAVKFAGGNSLRTGESSQESKKMEAGQAETSPINGSMASSEDIHGVDDSGTTIEKLIEILTKQEASETETRGQIDSVILAGADQQRSGDATHPASGSDSTQEPSSGPTQGPDLAGGTGSACPEGTGLRVSNGVVYCASVTLDE